MTLNINDINYANEMNEHAFVTLFGCLFEDSPWVAKEAWQTGKPFHSWEHLYEVMVIIVRSASEGTKLQLLRLHPDLGAKIRMSNHSVREQRGAGLDDLEPREYEEFSELNRTYTAKFGFPFIIAVKGKSKDDILQAMKQRSTNHAEAEWTQALSEVEKIAAIRLEKLLHNNE
ncbi:hypothetical protein SY83_16735 [Paenibacillus swuensis]|uniref:2-oxo-4-hydroxy-4-carboxy-5-ureidoimidazoline decarboxylase n=1 Tax=Paenibacillus swuensis TaxID=1178515 RepID=A0A172TKS2_9BACL|nr:2-oxo-4-hydroxy-4-carboxy-5-ureidoimidazoline decarboxylase [Paenibacillus swuensis]ANE47655.1 hypothetical protein SY83_16735 [Paenibacillus swuensis]